VVRALLAVLTLALAACGGPAPARTSVDAAEQRAAAERMGSAARVLESVRRAPDAGLPVSIAQSARCLVIVPSMVQVALLLGARRGRGVGSCRTTEGWSRPAFFRATGAGAGFAIGIATIDLVLVVVSDDTARSLLRTRIEFGIDASLAAGPVGRSAEGATSIAQGAFSYSMASGVFAGASITNLAIEQDEEAERAYYGDERSFAVLLRGTNPVPPSAVAFLDVVRSAIDEPW
jgi:lipid-binding SYLF domain-containing protein